MPSFNQINFLGHATRDPQTKNVGSTSITEFGMAANRKWKTSNGEDREEVCFIECKCWGRGGEVIAQYVQKGNPLFVSGRLGFETWEDKDTGSKRSKHVIIVENFQLLGGRQNGDGSNQASGSRTQQHKDRLKEQQPAGPGFDEDQPPDFDSIPF